MINFVTDERLKITFPSDFVMRIDEVIDRDGKSIDPELLEFRFEFFGNDVFNGFRLNKKYDPEEQYIVSYDGVERVNNYIEDIEVVEEIDGEDVVVVKKVLFFKFENYNIINENLCYRQVEKYPNSNFEDGFEDIITIDKTDIVIKTTGVNTETDNQILVTVSVSALKGVDGKSPYIDGTTGTWWTFDDISETFYDTGINATGPQGEKGDKGDIGNTGPKGDKGDKGEDGLFTGFATFEVDTETMELIMVVPETPETYNFELEDGYLIFNV